MDWTMWLALFLAVGLGCYLLVALLKPEWLALFLAVGLGCYLLVALLKPEWFS